MEKCEWNKTQVNIENDLSISQVSYLHLWNKISTCHGLIFNETNTGLHTNAYQVSPPLMEIKFVETLEMFLKEGVFFQTAAMVKGEWLPQ